MKRDFRQLLAMLTQAKDSRLDLPFYVEKRDIEIPFIATDGSVSRRSIRIYLPEIAPRPMPIVFIAHYEMTEADSLLSMYLKKGWAVSTPINYITEYNGTLIDDDLIFNNAALSVVKKQPDIDRTRIVVSGGSAGGYMAQMLSVLHLGICCTVSFSGIANIPFNMHYMISANGYNLAAMAELTEEERQDLVRCMEAMPVPILSAGANQFVPIQEKLQRDPNGKVWKALSPSCMTDCLTNPITYTHFTSDVLVPIDQLTTRYTYSAPGNSLPEGFRLRLSEFPLEEELQRSLAEALPADELSEKLYPAPQEAGENFAIPFDITKRFNIVVFDEGCVEGDAGHQKNLDIGTYDATAYMEAQLVRSSRDTNWLTAGKLALMAERYAGTSILIPGQSGIDDTAYGSLAMDRAIVLEDLSAFSEDRQKEYEEVFRAARKARPDLADALDEIKSHGRR